MQATELIANYGAIGILFLFFMKEFFSYLKTKKNGNGEKDSSQDSRIAVVETKIDSIIKNHLPHIEARQERMENKIDLILEKMLKYTK